VTVVLAHGTPLTHAVRWLIADMTAPVLGATLTVVLHLNVALLPWVLAFFVGSFLYIGASDLLPEAREHDSPWVMVATVLGMLAIYFTTAMLRGWR
jgi:ZIP family zinc transporter